MEIRDKRIDGGTAFDWGRTSEAIATEGWIDVFAISDDKLKRAKTSEIFFEKSVDKHFSL